MKLISVVIKCLGENQNQRTVTISGTLIGVYEIDSLAQYIFMAISEFDILTFREQNL